MLYCIYNEFPLNGWRTDIGKDKSFVDAMVKSYLRGGEEVIISGERFSAGSMTFQIFEVPTEFGSSHNIKRNLENSNPGKINSRILSALFKNVTDDFLFGKSFGDLKENYFNIYINDGTKKPIIIALTKTEVLNFLSEFEKGSNEIWVSGRKIFLENPKTIKIFDIEFKWLAKERGKIKETINKMKNLYGRWTLDILKNFGNEVTSDFEIKPFGSSKEDKKELNMSKNISSDKPKNKIFISHSSENESLVRKFVDLILDNALGCETSLIFCTSLEGLGIKSGEDFRNRIKSELLESKMVIQMISKEYKASEVCLNEMGAAWVLADHVIPFVLDDQYDIGFIHRSNQQLKINSKRDILQFVDDNGLFFPKKSGHAKINGHVDDFIKAITKATPTRNQKINQYEPKILILSAIYGWSTYQTDVTENLEDLVAKGTYAGKVEPGTFGISDPIYGEIKTLKIHYKLNGEEMTLSVRDNGTFKLIPD